jgi:hypothetical protein
MKVNTNELIDLALDWAVSQCKSQSFTYGDSEYEIDGRVFQRGGCSIERRYSSDWAHAGPIIEREMIDVCAYRSAWRAARYVGTVPTYGYGPTPLVAAMRCYVASKLGDTVDVPEELI